MSYLPVDVYTNRRSSDSSLNGVTTMDHIRLVVPCEEGHLSDDDIDDSRTVVLILREIQGSPHFKPEAYCGGHPMFGGNFVWSSDSRFRRQYGDQPIKVHDRFER